MSEVVYEDGGLSVVRFHGGGDRGICFQITAAGQYVQLTRAQTDSLLEALRFTLGEDRRAVLPR